MKTRSKSQGEIKWLDLIITSIGNEGWKHVYEVWETFETLIPPHAIYRKLAPRNQRGRRATLRSHMVTWIGGMTRYAIRRGMIERSIPIGMANSQGGGYKLRLTKKGIQRLMMIKRYLCLDCFHFSSTHGVRDDGRVCSHCRSRNLKFY